MIYTASVMPPKTSYFTLPAGGEQAVTPDQC